MLAVEVEIICLSGLIFFSSREILLDEAVHRFVSLQFVAFLQQIFEKRVSPGFSASSTH